MGKAKIEIDEELENRIKKMYSAGMKMTRISKETGVSYHAVCRVLKTGKTDNLTFFRIPENKRLIAKPLTKEETESLRYMHNNFRWSVCKISKMTGISYCRVRYAVDDEYRESMRERCREYSRKNENHRQHRHLERKQQLREEIIKEAIKNGECK